MKETKATTGQRDVPESAPKAERPIGPLAGVHALHRLVGNRAVAALLSSPSEGEALPEPLAREASERFGPLARRARVHHDDVADRSARDLDAEAFTVGQDIYVRRNAFDPASAVGQNLLLHESAHAAQHRAGLLPGSETALEQQADRAAASSSPMPALAGERVPSPAGGGSVQVLRQATETTTQAQKKLLKVNVYVDQGTINFVVEGVKGYERHSGKLIYNGEPRPGTYHRRRDPQTQRFPPLTPFEAGGTMDKATGLVLQWRSDVAYTLSGVQEYTLEVIGGRGGAGATGAGIGTTGQAPGDPEGAANEPIAARPAAETWREIQELPPHIKEFLTAERGRRASKEDYERVLLIGKRLQDAGVTPEELYDYRRNATPGAGSLKDLERSIAVFLEVRLATRARRSQNIVERETARNKLFGLNDLFVKYQRYREKSRPSAATLASADAAMMAAHEASTLLDELNKELPRHGFTGNPPHQTPLAEFEQYIRRFADTFQRETLAFAFDLLLKSEYILVRAQAQFRDRDAEATRLQGTLGPIREPAQDLYRQAKRTEREAASEAFDYPDPERFKSKQFEAAETRRKADEKVASVTSKHPIINWKDFPREELLGAKTPMAIRHLMGRYIYKQLMAIRSARETLREKPDRVFQLDILLKASRDAQGFPEDSIYALIIRHRADEIDREQSVINALLTILAIALSIVTFGAGGWIALIAAGAAFGISAYQAFDELEKYDENSRFYVANLLSKEPTIAWAILAVVGAGVDAAGVVQALKVVAPAAKAFTAPGGDLKTLSDALTGVDERIVRNVEKAAKAKQQFEAAVEGLVATSGRVSAFILPAEEFARFVAVAYYTIKRGFVSFEAFYLELRRLKLVKELAQLAPEELTRLKTAHLEALAHSSSGKAVYGEGTVYRNLHAKLSENARAAFDPEAVDQLAAHARAAGKGEQEVLESIESSARQAKVPPETPVGAAEPVPTARSDVQPEKVVPDEPGRGAGAAGGDVTATTPASSTAKSGGAGAVTSAGTPAEQYRRAARDSLVRVNDEFGDLIAADPALRRRFRRAARLAKTDPREAARLAAALEEELVARGGRDVANGAVSSDRRNTGGVRELRWFVVGRDRRRGRRCGSGFRG